MRSRQVVCPSCRTNVLLPETNANATPHCPHCQTVLEAENLSDSSLSATNAESNTEGETTTLHADLPQRAGRYHVLEEIGRGGMGAVLRVRDPVLQRSLAIKILLQDTSAKANDHRRFLEEARITGLLQHPGIPPIHDLGYLDNRRPYFAMKLIEGQTLASLLSARQVSPGSSVADLPRFLSIFGQVCQSLAYAHSRNIIHRDLKPANIMVGAFGEVQVMDWGLAKDLSRIVSHDPEAEPTDAEADADPMGQSLTRTGQMMGTLAYMPPEQARGEVRTLDPRCDVFSLGAILYEILVGRRMYQSKSFKQLLDQVGQGDLDSALKKLDACGTDPQLIALTKHCLQRTKEDRPEHAGVLADAIDRYETEVQQRLRQAELDKAQAEVQAVEDRKRHEVEEARTDAERRRRNLQLTLAVVVAIALLAGVLGTGWGLVQVDESRVQALAARDAERDRAEGERRAKAAAESARGEAEQERDAAFRSAYLADMRVAQEDSTTGQITRMCEILARYVPQTGRPDVRGWEWYYLLSQIHREQTLLRGHNCAVRDLAWSTEGDRLASVGSDGTVRLWDVEQRQELFRLQTATLWCEWSPVGDQLVTATKGQLLRWDTTTGKQVGQVQTHVSTVHESAWHPGGKLVAYSCTDSVPVSIVDLETGKQLDSPFVRDEKEGAASKLVWSPDGARLAYISGRPYPIRLWQVDTGIPSESSMVDRRGDRAGTTISSSPDGKELVDGHTFFVIVDRSGKNKRRIDAGAETTDLCWSPDGRHVAVALTRFLHFPVGFFLA